MRKFIQILFLLLTSLVMNAQEDSFKITWQGFFVRLPIQPGATSYTIDWGDGTPTESYTDSSPFHAYKDGLSLHIISYTGTFTYLDFANNPNLKSVKQWGSQKWESMEKMFSYCLYFNDFPNEVPNLTLCTSMAYMFNELYDFNQPIGLWDVSNVKNMSAMFRSASAFNQPIGSWNVGNVTNMLLMFGGASVFNQPIDNWNVSNVTNMRGMFNATVNFNNPIGSWNVGNVTDMSFMFSFAKKFNQPLDSWDVSKVTNMEQMFNGATNFDQPLGSWDVSKVTNMSNMFNGVKLSTTNYDNLLIGWANLGKNGTGLQKNVIFHGGNSNYCNGQEARDYLKTTYNWIITDGGFDCNLDNEGFDFDISYINVYPNPVKNVLNIKIEDKLINKSFIISDALGKIYSKGKLKQDNTSLNIEDLSTGIYFITIENSKAIKFIKQ